jgi:subtilisin-like proprotein convertase family protein
MLMSRFHHQFIVGSVVLFVLLTGTVSTLAATITRQNPGTITIPDSGAASPFPSTIEVSGMSGNLADVNVTISGISHENPADIAILLVGPTGQSVILMDDSGGESGRGASNVTLTFDDAASTMLPQDIDGGLVSGTFKPTPAPLPNISCNAVAAPPTTPAGPHGTTLAAFNGTAPNGTWSLYVYDDCSPGSGSISGGWSLQLTALGPAIFVPEDITVATDPGQPSAVVSFPVSGIDHGGNPLTPSCSPASGSTFPIGTTTVECMVTDDNGREAFDSFTVTVIDDEGPILNLPAPIEVTTDGATSAVVTYVATATDNSGKVSLDCSPPSGATFPLGTTTVSCIATDTAGNNASGSFTVTVKTPSTNPTDPLAKLRSDTILLVINSQVERALLATIDQAQQAANRGNSLGVYFAMLKFVVQIERYEASGAISLSVARQLLLDARLVLTTRS